MTDIGSRRYNESIMKPEHHQNQDTNDRFMANIQRNGTFSVVPRIAAGEITPEGLIAIGQVAKKYKLYTKVKLSPRKKCISTIDISSFHRLLEANELTCLAL